MKLNMSIYYKKSTSTKEVLNGTMEQFEKVVNSQDHTLYKIKKAQPK